MAVEAAHSDVHLNDWLGFASKNCLMTADLPKGRKVRQASWLSLDFF